MTRRAEILIIGNEILSGKVADEHGVFLCREFRALGVDVRRMVVLPDEIGPIADAVRSAWTAADIVVTTGGVGPTHDDVTLAGIALGLARPLVKDPTLAALILELYGAQADHVVERMAEVPEGATLIRGEGLRIPVVLIEKIYVFPGVPEIFRRKFLAVKERFRDEPFHFRRIHLAIGEEPIASTLYDVAAKFPALLLGSYPVVNRPDYRVRLTLESKDARYLDDALAYLMARLPASAIVPTDDESQQTS
ncbi:MAG: competence/damage-inducible protein A [Nitrospiria bacterium]